MKGKCESHLALFNFIAAIRMKKILVIYVLIYSLLKNEPCYSLFSERDCQGRSGRRRRGLQPRLPAEWSPAGRARRKTNAFFSNVGAAIEIWRATTGGWVVVVDSHFLSLRGTPYEFAYAEKLRWFCWKLKRYCRESAIDTYAESLHVFWWKFIV